MFLIAFMKFHVPVAMEKSGTTMTNRVNYNDQVLNGGKTMTKCSIERMTMTKCSMDGLTVTKCSIESTTISTHVHTLVCSGIGFALSAVEENILYLRDI